MSFKYIVKSWQSTVLMLQRQHAKASATACWSYSDNMPELQRQHAEATATTCRSYSNSKPTLQRQQAGSTATARQRSSDSTPTLQLQNIGHQTYQSFKSCNQLKTLTIHLRQCFKIIKNWMSLYFLELNDPKTKIIVVGSGNVLNNIQLGGINMLPSTTITFVSCVKNLDFFVGQSIELPKTDWRSQKIFSYNQKHLQNTIYSWWWSM